MRVAAATWRALAPALAPAPALALALALVVASCGGTGPRVVVLGQDECDYCRMEVTDARFASEVVTGTGRIHLFDSVECMAGYVRGAETGTVATIWVTDAEHPGTFVAAERAGFLSGSSLQGPMGTTVAFASPEAARTAQGLYGGTLKEWASVLADTTGHSGSAH